MAKKANDNFIIKTLNGMAYGFFSSLIIGTILKQMGTYFGIQQFVTWGNIASNLMGPAIGVGIAISLDAKGLNMICSVIAGAIGAGTLSGGVQVGNPIGAYIAVVFAVIIVKLIQDKTPIDIILTPLVAIIVSGIITIFVSPYITIFIQWVGSLINDSVAMQPILMSILVAVLMGMALTMPISSAALGVMLNLSGLAAGAALIGCCCQMVILAMMTYHDNRIGDVIAVGIGTSMLQFKNIVAKPILWLPAIIASMILAPIGVIVFNIQCTAIGSGMGMAGLVGVMQAIDVMGISSAIIIILFTLILPLLVGYPIYNGLVRLKYIKSGDLKLNKL